MAVSFPIKPPRVCWQCFPDISRFVLLSIKAGTQITWSDRQKAKKTNIWHSVWPHKHFLSSEVDLHYMFVWSLTFLKGYSRKWKKRERWRTGGSWQEGFLRSPESSSKVPLNLHEKYHGCMWLFSCISRCKQAKSNTEKAISVCCIFSSTTEINYNKEHFNLCSNFIQRVYKLIHEDSSC